MTQYAIPSRRRPDALCSMTLPELVRLGVNLADVTVFVHPDEHLAYTFELIEHGYDAVTLAPGKHGMANQRNTILNFMMSGEHIVELDDDIKRVLARRDEKTLEPITPDEWAEILAHAEGFLRAGRTMWGVYPVKNPFFMKPRVHTGLAFVVGCFHGYLANPNPESPLYCTIDGKDDYERTLACYTRGGGIARFDWITVDHRRFYGQGGMQADGERTEAKNHAEAAELQRRYPNLVRLRKSAKGLTEITLRQRGSA